MTVLPFRRTEFARVPVKDCPEVLAFELSPVESRVENEVPAGRIRGGGGGGGGAGAGASTAAGGSAPVVNPRQ